MAGRICSYRAGTCNRWDIRCKPRQRSGRDLDKRQRWRQSLARVPPRGDQEQPRRDRRADQGDSRGQDAVQRGELRLRVRIVQRWTGPFRAGSGRVRQLRGNPVAVGNRSGTQRRDRGPGSEGQGTRAVKFFTKRGLPEFVAGPKCDSRPAHSGRSGDSFSASYSAIAGRLQRSTPGW
jgi:hypothetical protein